MIKSKALSNTALYPSTVHVQSCMLQEQIVHTHNLLSIRFSQEDHNTIFKKQLQVKKKNHKTLSFIICFFIVIIFYNITLVIHVKYP